MSSKAKTLARRLLKQNRGTRSKPARSWRVIVREDYQNKIPAGTLCRFALEDGEWMPKDEYLFVIGLKHERKTKCTQPKELFDMATSTLRYMLDHREKMPDTDPRILKQFQKLGWLQKVGAR